MSIDPQAIFKVISMQCCTHFTWILLCLSVCFLLDMLFMLCFCHFLCNWSWSSRLLLFAWYVSLCCLCTNIMIAYKSLASIFHQLPLAEFWQLILATKWSSFFPSWCSFSAKSSTRSAIPQILWLEPLHVQKEYIFSGVQTTSYLSIILLTSLLIFLYCLYQIL